MKISKREMAAHATTLDEVHPELTKKINDFLAEKNIPLKVHSFKLAEATPETFGCCVINGQVHCGPECP
jgi:hypothetical protein